jgi:hypothetical protein
MLLTGEDISSPLTHAHRKEQEMIVFLLLCLVLIAVVLSLAVQGWLFKNPDDTLDPQWELYQQRYD